jgi:hypothetical protein
VAHVGVQIGSWLKVSVIEVGVDVLSLDVASNEDSCDGGREFTVSVVKILRHLSQTVEKLRVIRRDALLHFAGVAKGPWSIGIISAT